MNNNNNPKPQTSDPITQTSDPTPQPGFFSKIFKGDKVIWSVFIALCVVSLIEVFSATSTIVYRQQNHWGPILRHATFLLGGVGVILFIHNVPYRYFSSLVFVLFGSIILLILTPFIGTTVNGAERWISIMGLTIQPSEIAKISLMGTVAFLLSKQNDANEGTLFKWMIGLTTGVSLIIAMDNLSTALLLFLVSFVLMFIGNVRFKRLAKVALIGIAALILAVLILKVTPTEWTRKGAFSRVSTWQARIDRFGNKPDKDEASYYQITDENYQVAHSKIAIANGGLLGRFPGNSKERDFLPQAYSDFIYAIILEEMGLLGGTMVLIFYIIILIRAGMIARKTEKLFPKYLILGSALMLSMQAFVNMAVAVHLIPVTGQPLPLISRGGTSTLITCAYFGIILSADRFGFAKKKSTPAMDMAVMNIDSLQTVDGEDESDNNSVADTVIKEGYESEVDFEVIKA
ncbi:MAG TPA: FtsW/RodA/SpoVE family cell cycle protein [Dysgonamonadaceae bacterium]|nr:FtsW/RodA/SpoVE family cell cycle protein [Dysgonamonadaceae bacterium]HUI33329.1 FtsW/RodA/SpoVE family cell cycle protein [Dysgonamonadaceae bacterium]